MRVGHAPAHRARFGHAAHAHDRSGNGMGRRNRDAELGGHEQRECAARLCGKAADGLQLGDAHAERATRGLSTRVETTVAIELAES